MKYFLFLMTRDKFLVIITIAAGELPKWLKGRAWKARRLVTGREGSNPSFSAIQNESEPLWLGE